MADTDEITIGEIQIAGSALERMVRESIGRVSGVSQIKSITITPKNDALTFDINLVVHHNTVYPEVAEVAQKAVSNDVNCMTGAKVEEVNIMIERLDFSGE
ncbi:MAG: Asp23/Gls24 family envelope stress response protein [Actinomycetota bacterium]